MYRRRVQRRTCTRARRAYELPFVVGSRSAGIYIYILERYCANSYTNSFPKPIRDVLSMKLHRRHRRRRVDTILFYAGRAHRVLLEWRVFNVTMPNKEHCCRGPSMFLWFTKNVYIIYIYKKNVFS